MDQTYCVAPDWVFAQTLERHRRELEANELERVDRLRKARHKEASLRKAALARTKRAVNTYYSQYCWPS